MLLAARRAPSGALVFFVNGTGTPNALVTPYSPLLLVPTTISSSSPVTQDVSCLGNSLVF